MKTYPNFLTELFDKPLKYRLSHSVEDREEVYEFKTPKGQNIEVSIVVDKIKKTPSDLERVYLSILSTPCKKIVVNKKEKINIPIIDERKGRISRARSPIIINNNNL